MFFFSKKNNDRNGSTSRVRWKSVNYIVSKNLTVLFINQTHFNYTEYNTIFTPKKKNTGSITDFQHNNNNKKKSNHPPQSGYKI